MAVVHMLSVCTKVIQIIFNTKRVKQRRGTIVEYFLFKWLASLLHRVLLISFFLLFLYIYVFFFFFFLRFFYLFLFPTDADRIRVKVTEHIRIHYTMARTSWSMPRLHNIAYVGPCKEARLCFTSFGVLVVDLFRWWTV